jgi:hypothetical protein
MKLDKNERDILNVLLNVENGKRLKISRQKFKSIKNMPEKPLKRTNALI